MEEENEYILRGQRVSPLSPQTVKRMACSAMSILNINRNTIKNMDIFIEDIWDKYSINVELIPDQEWLGFAEALCDPSRFTIAIPEKMYTDIVKYKDKNAIFIFFHELGHLLLGHKPALHYSLLPPSLYEDAEWQADYFAEVILNKIAGVKHKQLDLFM